VPEVLLSGNHEQIRKWRERKALEKTKRMRPDMMGRQTPEDSRRNDKDKD